MKTNRTLFQLMLLVAIITGSINPLLAQQIVQKGSDIDGEAADDQSGWSVSMPSATTVAIRARLSNGSVPGQVML